MCKLRRYHLGAKLVTDKVGDSQRTGFRTSAKECSFFDRDLLNS